MSNTDKVYGLSKFWQEVNYNFVYLDKVDRAKWDEDYKLLLEEVQNTESDYEYYRLLQKFCATLKDGHTNVYFPENIQSTIFTSYFGEYRLFVTNIANKAIITRINLSKKDEIPIGTEVIKVNGMKTQEYLEQEVIPYISSSTEHILMDWAVSRMFRAPKGTSFDITLKLPNGERKDLTITHEETTEKEVYPAFEERELMDFKWYKDDVAYISLNSFSNPKIDSLFMDKLPQLRKAKKLIVDLRFNGGGNTSIGTNILQYLTYDSLLHGSAYSSRLHIPAFKAWGKWYSLKDTIGASEEDKKWLKQAVLSHQDNYFHYFPYNPKSIDLDREERIVIPTAILIGHNTASAAEDFLIAADNQKHMVKIGEPTFGSTGQPLSFDMPGGGSARICTKKDTYPGGKEFVGYGILPDIQVTKSYDDYMENKDPVLEKAIQYLDKK
ncbi:peptidase S41 [Lutimonas saemankumensis]|uniref:S41 family peptidase n=1 Tax=Lutimonas saemankumensis TaxID=483016 RepID=UPI001CD4852F|nr:S41 family peptidase [Lutimonas saemankumensis]MCA0931283.1 peptidase S41 [Lutimonas saemankumensis]